MTTSFYTTTHKTNKQTNRKEKKQNNPAQTSQAWIYRLYLAAVHHTSLGNNKSIVTIEEGSVRGLHTAPGAEENTRRSGVSSGYHRLVAATSQHAAPRSAALSCCVCTHRLTKRFQHLVILLQLLQARPHAVEIDASLASSVTCEFLSK